jgi:hypothetical protein
MNERLADVARDQSEGISRLCSNRLSVSAVSAQEAAHHKKFFTLYDQASFIESVILN